MTPAVTDYFPPCIEQMLKTAQRELDNHSDDDGTCVVCRSTFPCPRAELAALALGAF
jgi:hypothetical protein